MSSISLVLAYSVGFRIKLVDLFEGIRHTRQRLVVKILSDLRRKFEMFSARICMDFVWTPGLLLLPYLHPWTTGQLLKPNTYEGCACQSHQCVSLPVFFELWQIRGHIVIISRYIKYFTRVSFIIFKCRALITVSQYLLLGIGLRLFLKKDSTVENTFIFVCLHFVYFLMLMCYFFNLAGGSSKTARSSHNVSGVCGVHILRAWGGHHQTGLCTLRSHQEHWHVLGFCNNEAQGQYICFKSSFCFSSIKCFGLF